MTEWVILWEISAAVLTPLRVNDVAVLKAGSALSRSVHFMFFFLLRLSTTFSQRFMALDSSTVKTYLRYSVAIAVYLNAT